MNHDQQHHEIAQQLTTLPCSCFSFCVFVKEEEDRRRSRRKRSPSADSDEGAIGANGALGHSGIAGARGRLEDEEMPDVA